MQSRRTKSNKLTAQSVRTKFLLFSFLVLFLGIRSSIKAILPIERLKETLRTNKPLVQGMFMNTTTALEKASEAHIYLQLDLLGNMNTLTSTTYRQ